MATLLAACGTVQGPIASAPTSVPLPAQTASATPVYAALGASETYGIGAEPITRGYAYQVRDAIGATGFADLGIPAVTLGTAYETEIAGALALRPTVCTVFFGVNDIRGGVNRDSFMTNLRDLVTTLQRAKCRTFVVGLPDLAQLPAVVRAHLSGLAATTADWNAGMAAAAVQGGGAFLSLTAFSAEIAAHPEYIAADGLHPSTIGHARLAAVVVAAVRSAGAVH
ncbi:MAG: SGNH/GDSL hydrolase family protein [Candidatus Dormibacteraeota bacterium]|nr:SGNH/GDSL hydrolase family protein [Candidatus Dormibacteraeota bacterium]